MQASLVGPSGSISLTSSVLTIGRAADNQLVLSDSQASSHHVQVLPDAQGYAIVDLDSTNGTFVNEQRLMSKVLRPLTPGDVIRIGSTRFSYEMAGSYDATRRAGAPDFAANAYQPTISASPPSPSPTNPPPQPGYQQYQSYPDYPSYQSQDAQPPSAYGAYGQGNPSYQQPQPSYTPNYQQQQYPAQAPQNYSPPQAGFQQQWGSAPGQMGAPGLPQAAAAQPRKKSRAGLIIALVVLLLILVGGGIGGYLFLRSTPEKTLGEYCTALKQSDAQGIYNLESTSAQSRVNLNDLRLGLALIDSPAGGGGVTNCVVGPVTNNNGTTADGTVTITLGNGKSITDTGVLVNESGTWKLSNTPQGQ